jgi:hypothetical protein
VALGIEETYLVRRDQIYAANRTLYSEAMTSYNTGPAALTHLRCKETVLHMRHHATLDGVLHQPGLEDLQRDPFVSHDLKHGLSGAVGKQQLNDSLVLFCAGFPRVARAYLQ